MLRILNMQIPYKYKPTISAKRLFEDNGCFIFDVEAPAFWWVDFGGERANINANFVDATSRLSTLVRGNIFLPYQDIVELCEDYISGAFKKENTKWIAEREWSDFCETLLDIRGVRDLLYGEEI